MAKAFMMGKVAEAVGMPRPTLAKWVEIGLPIIHHLRDTTSPGKGQAAILSFHTAMQIGLAYRLVRLGVSPRDAVPAARKFGHFGGTGRKAGRPFPTGHTVFVYPKAFGHNRPVVHFATDAELKQGLFEHFTHFYPPAPMVNLNEMYETIAANLGLDPTDYRNRERSGNA